MSDNMKRYTPSVYGVDMRESERGSYFKVDDCRTALSLKEQEIEQLKAINNNLIDAANLINQTVTGLGKMLYAAKGDLAAAEERIEQLQKELVVALHAANDNKERARVAEEREKWEEHEADKYMLQVADRDVTISRLTAECEEWREKCAGIQAECDTTESKRYTAWKNLIDAEYERDVLRSDLRTLRRSSVRVDVLERWCTMWINDHTPYRLVTGLRDACRSRRSTRPVNEKGEGK